MPVILCTEERNYTASLEKFKLLYPIHNLTAIPRQM
jgi:hypothetical protein